MSDEDSSINVEVEPDVILHVNSDHDTNVQYSKSEMAAISDYANSYATSNLNRHQELLNKLNFSAHAYHPLPPMAYPLDQLKAKAAAFNFDLAAAVYNNRFGLQPPSQTQPQTLDFSHHNSTIKKEYIFDFTLTPNNNDRQHREEETRNVKQEAQLNSDNHYQQNSESGQNEQIENKEDLNNIVAYNLSNRHDQCPFCGKYYRKLARHMLKHAEIGGPLPDHEYFRRIQCNQCNETFEKRIQLEEHLRCAHGSNGGKPFVCAICDKGFAQNCNLINHMRTHTGDKPFHCSQCDKRFSQSGNLKNHLRLHNNEKPYVCPLCYQAFRQLSNLNNHSKKHPNYKPPTTPTSHITSNGSLNLKTVST